MCRQVLMPCACRVALPIDTGDAAASCPGHSCCCPSNGKLTRTDIDAIPAVVGLQLSDARLPLAVLSGRCHMLGTLKMCQSPSLQWWACGCRRRGCRWRCCRTARRTPTTPAWPPGCASPTPPSLPPPSTASCAPPTVRPWCNHTRFACHLGRVQVTHFLFHRLPTLSLLYVIVLLRMLRLL